MVALYFESHSQLFNLVICSLAEKRPMGGAPQQEIEAKTEWCADNP